MSSETSRFNIKKIILFVLAAILLICAVILILIRTHVIFIGTSVENISYSSVKDFNSLISTVNLNTDNSDQVHGTDGYTVRLQNQKIVWSDDSGSIINTGSYEFNNPIFVSAEDFLCVAENDGRKIVVYEGTSEKWSADLDGNIYNININKHGYVCVLREYLGYKSALEVYRPDGTRIFYTCKAYRKIIHAEVSGSDESVFMSSVSLSDVDVTCYAEWVDMEGNTIKEQEYQGVCMGAFCYDDENAVIVEENRIDLFPLDDNSSVIIDDLQISDFAFADDKLCVLGQDNADGNSNLGKTILVIDIDGKILDKLIFENYIAGISAVNNKIGVNFGNICMIVSTGGNIKGGCSTDRTIQRIIRLDSGKAMAVTEDKGYICDI